MMRHASLVVVSALLLSAVGCGGIVVFDDGGAGGSGGSSSSSVTPTTGPGAGPGSGVGTATSTGATTTGPFSVCEYFCDRLAGCIDSVDCLADCASVYQPGCEVQADALLSCFADEIDPATCDYAGGCEPFEQSYQQCIGVGPGGCTEEECFAGPNQCGCSGTCQGIDVSNDCTLNANGANCQCFLGGDFVGNCSQPFSDCGFDTSCCQGLWFGFDDGPPPPPPN